MRNPVSLNNIDGKRGNYLPKISDLHTCIHTTYTYTGRDSKLVITVKAKSLEEERNKNCGMPHYRVVKQKILTAVPKAYVVET